MILSHVWISSTVGCENVSSPVAYFMHVQSVWKLKCKTGALSILKYLLQFKYLLAESLC